MALAGRIKVDETVFAPMEVKHLPQVLDIEQRSFPTPWSKKAFMGELRHNRFAHYYVCLLSDRVVGYAGMWVILDEAHVTNIAVDPHYRRKDLGKQLLLYLIQCTLYYGADKITLEVRPSNTGAQKLYRELGFADVGVRKGYYTDNNEDAIIMWKHLLRDD